jgi:inorganic pyrophosphatase/K(+)-stimulated pyrophosphate-energized sodium pump
MTRERKRMMLSKMVGQGSWRGWWVLGLAAVILFLSGNPAVAQATDEPTSERESFFSLFGLYWVLAFAGSIVALVFAFRFYRWMIESDEGNPTMVEIAGYVRTGANAYLRQQYKIVGLFFVVIFALLVYVSFGLGAQSRWVPFAFITGGFFSGLAGWFGMKTATWASSRTAAGAQKSLNQGLQVAFRSGAVMGLTVVGLGLLDIMLWFLVLYWIVPLVNEAYRLSLIDITVTMLCFGMGASSQALFARVGGGIFTKAADVGADLVGKVEHSIPEDDPRNPATIADNVGDNVGDVAGMGADLYESYCGSILATAALGVAAFATEEMQLSAIFLPMLIAGFGTALSILGIYAVRTEESATQKTLLAALARGINLSTVLIVVVSIALSYWLLGAEHWKVSLSVIVGLFAGWLIGKWTEYSTSNDYKPTQGLADQSVTGPATIIIGGVAEGMLSTWVPVLVVSAATLSAFGFANDWDFTSPGAFALGLYGVGIAAVGMLSTLGITLATDAYGPIADNAGGNAQMSGLEPIVRERTDALDALGNTTAATGKGFAIGSAALTALALLAAYIEEVRVGFDRWGHAVAENVEGEPTQYLTIEGQRTLMERGDWVKLNRGVVVQLGASPAENEPYLVLEENAISGFDELPPHSEVTTEFDPARLEQQRDLVPVRTATMADFMRYYDVTLMNPKILVGILTGSMLVFVFCALTMKAVGRAAKGMVEEVRRQFREKPGIMQHTDKPDYAAPVAISTKAAQREMIVPSLLALIIPVVTGLLLGVGGVMGLLVGGLATGFCVAVFMANAGGAWDNAKKHIEGGAHGGKGTDAHKAAVVGDTVGDPFKDTSGPSLNILIKLMSMVSVVVAGLVVRYSLYALGIF